MRRIALAMLVFITLALGACGGGDSDDSSSGDSESSADSSTETTVSDILFSSDFEQVCRGIAQEGGSTVGTSGGTSPLLVFTGVDPEYSQAFGVVPDEWEPEFGDEATIEMVLCLDRTAETESELCEGYEDDGIEWAVQTFDATYEVTLRAATTAEVIASTSIDAAADGCPMFSSYSQGDPSPVPNYARPDDAIQAFAVEHVQG